MILIVPRVKGFLRRLRSVGMACALIAALGGGVTATTTVLTAAPALAANGPCYDVTIANPTSLHQWPSYKSLTVKFLPSNHTVTGTCNYSYNHREGYWFMMVNYIGPNNNNGYGYIWVQRLQYGRSHHCKKEYGALLAIGSSACPLYLYSGP